MCIIVRNDKQRIIQIIPCGKPGIKVQIPLTDGIHRIVGWIEIGGHIEVVGTKLP